jgi:DNA-directed RNA polymerase specialized sigma24 family protein
VKALPKWVITTASREAWAMANQHRTARADVEQRTAPQPDDATIERLDRAKIVNAGLQRLGGKCEELLRLLFSGSGEPDYRHIADALRMPLGSIGPTRSRCLAKLAELLRNSG